MKNTMMKLGLLTLAAGAVAGACTKEEPAPQPAVPEPVSYLCEVKVDGVAAEELVKTAADAVLSLKEPLRKAPNKLHEKNSLEEDVLSVFFTTNSDTMFRNDLNDVANYARSLSDDAKSVVVEGYADHRGDVDDNFELSKKRAGAVSEVLQRNAAHPLKIKTAAFGESKATSGAEDAQSTRKDRKVRVVPDRTVIQRGLDLLVSDTYLLDQSGSMNETIGNGASKWKQVQDYTFPEGADVYTFSSDARQCGGHISQEVPSGMTPLFSTMYELLERTEKGKSVTVLTDGYDTVGGRSPNEVIGLAKQKDISISMLGIGVNQYKETLVTIAKETGGRFYLAN